MLTVGLSLARSARVLFLVALLGLTSPVGLAHADPNSVIYLQSCINGDDATGAWLPVSSGAGMSAANSCGTTGSLRLEASGLTHSPDQAEWGTTVPSQMSLDVASVPESGVLINPKAYVYGFAIRYHWADGSQSIADTGSSFCGGMDYGSGISANLGGARWFELQATCNNATCDPPSGQLLDVRDITLVALDNTAPVITPNEATENLADAANKWVRGSWNASFTADSQAGVCVAYVTVDANAMTSTAAQPRNTGSWTQCGEGAGTLAGSGQASVSDAVDTTTYPNGPLTLGYYAADAATPANVANSTYAVNVDNDPVSLALSGPTEEDSANSAVVKAVATAGPSGAQITCTVDGGSPTTYQGPTASVSVSGIGEHMVSCFAQNHAIDEHGTPAGSSPVLWHLAIRKPTVSVASLAHIADALQCRRTTERVHLPARWVTETYHGHSVRVRIPAQSRRISVVRCHPHFAVVHVRRGGRTVTERIVELPHQVQGTHATVAFGQSAAVSGWLGDADGNAVGGQTVEILTAPANGDPVFTPEGTVRTRDDGTWSARIVPGPSRVVEARYDGTADLAPSTSPPTHLTVPASPTVNVSPSRTYWGHRIAISGQLRGGYIPSSGELVVLRIGWSGGSAEIGHVYTNAEGAFHATYTFLRGSGSEAYRIWAQTARESDYPFAPATSPALAIRVS